nr:hypothetical protein [uncultured Duncaniella sp.]
MEARQAKEQIPTPLEDEDVRSMPDDSSPRNAITDIDVQLFDVCVAVDGPSVLPNQDHVALTQRTTSFNHCTRTDAPDSVVIRTENNPIRDAVYGAMDIDVGEPVPDDMMQPSARI